MKKVFMTQKIIKKSILFNVSSIGLHHGLWPLATIFANCTQHFSISIIPCCYLTKMFCLKMFLWHPWLQKAWFFFQYKHHLPSQWPLMSSEVFFKMQVTLLHHFWMHWGILTVCKSDLFSSMTTMTCRYTALESWRGI